VGGKIRVFTLLAKSRAVGITIPGLRGGAARASADREAAFGCGLVAEAIDEGDFQAVASVLEALIAGVFHAPVLPVDLRNDDRAVDRHARTLQVDAREVV